MTVFILALSIHALSILREVTGFVPMRGYRKGFQCTPTDVSTFSLELNSSLQQPSPVSTEASTHTTLKIKRRRNSKKWNRMISELQRYYNMKGHTLVSSEENAELAEWCKTLRRNYRYQFSTHNVSEHRPKLSQEDMEQLNNLHFVWNVQDYIWNQRFQELCSFRSRHGNFNVPLNTKLGVWLQNQKGSYRAFLQGKISIGLNPGRLAALSSIGLWDHIQVHTDIWNQRYQELEDFHSTMGHSNVPEDYAENYQLGQWVMNQRTMYKSYLAGLPTALTPARITRLEALEFRWNLHAHNWFSMLRRLEEFEEKHGHVNIPFLDESNRDLKIWLSHQRNQYQRKLQGRPSSMTDQRQAALERLSQFQWSTPKNEGPKLEDWDDLFAEIREKGIVPGMPPKQHWFDGQTIQSAEVKDIYTDDDLLDLWNQEDDE